MQITVIRKRGEPLPNYLTIFGTGERPYPIEVGTVTNLFPTIIGQYTYDYPLTTSKPEFITILSKFSENYPLSVSAAPFISVESKFNVNYPVAVGSSSTSTTTLLSTRVSNYPLSITGRINVNPIYTLMTVTGAGVNDTNNNTFLDSSSNNFSITRIGDPSQGSSSPFSTPAGNYSVYFSGNSDYLKFTGLTATTLNGDFTIEAWVYVNSNNSGDPAICSIGKYNSGGGLFFISSSTGELRFWQNTTLILSSNVAINNQIWTHVALVRQGSTLTIYINGTAQGSSTFSGTISDPDNVGTFISNGQANLSLSSHFLNGNISNLRIVKDTAVYTGNFTPSAAPLSAISGTSVLTCQSNRYVDNSTNNFAITAFGGNTRVNTFGPFTASSYNKNTMGGSIYFDGNEDYLQAPSNSAFTLGSSGNFTIECWVYPSATPSLTSVLATTYTNFNVSAGYNAKWCLLLRGTTIRWYNSIGDAGIDSSRPVAVSAWNHIAVVRNGGTITLYLNGVSAGTQTANQSYTDTAGLTIGYALGAGNYFTGYISNLRIVKGTAIYTSNFSVPTSPVTAVAGTSLLVNGSNAAIFDAAVSSNMATLGDAKISTAVSKWGTGSMVFDGSDYIPVAPNTNFILGDKNFTIEFWMYSQNNNGAQQKGMFQISNVTGGLSTSYTDGIVIIQGVTGSNTALTGALAVNMSGNVIGSTGAVINLNTWHHVAVVRFGTNVSLYVDGIRVGRGGGGNILGSNLAIGGYYNTSYLYIGYLQDLRISLGARYLNNFTPPGPL